MGATKKLQNKGKLLKALAERSLRQRRKRGAAPKAQATARGVRGHAPPENFLNLGANLCNLVHFWALNLNYKKAFF